MNDIRKLIGLRIKKIRKNRNLTQEKLCELSGVDETTLCRIETGKRLPSVDKLVLISKALNTDPNTILDFTSLNSPNQYNIKDLLLYEQICNLDDKTKEKIFTLIDVFK